MYLKQFQTLRTITSETLPLFYPIYSIMHSAIYIIQNSKGFTIQIQTRIKGSLQTNYLCIYISTCKSTVCAYHNDTSCLNACAKYRNVFCWKRIQKHTAEITWEHLTLLLHYTWLHELTLTIRLVRPLSIRSANRNDQLASSEYLINWLWDF